MSRPRVFVLHTKCGSIKPNAGDCIETIRFMTSLDHFCDVYYNGMKFDPLAKDFGLYEKEVEVPKEKYDLYYIRGNHKVFHEVPGPKVTMAYPYDERVFREADAIMVTTAEWKRLLESYSHAAESRRRLSKWYPADGIIDPKRIINVKQCFLPSMTEFSEKLVEIYRARFTFGDALGYFGRVTEETLPRILLHAVEQLKVKFNRLVVVAAGRIRDALPASILNAGQIPFAEMPSAIRACRGLMANEENDAEFLGSGKVLEAMATGVPIITKKNPVRIEQLGPDYPLYYENQFDAYQILDEFLSDSNLSQRASNHLAQRRELFSMEAQARRLEEEFSSLF